LAHTQADWARPETISAEAAGTRRKRKRWNTSSVLLFLPQLSITMSSLGQNSVEKQS